MRNNMHREAVKQIYAGIRLKKDNTSSVGGLTITDLAKLLSSRRRFGLTLSVLRTIP